MESVIRVAGKDVRGDEQDFEALGGIMKSHTRIFDRSRVRALEAVWLC
jgi:hypothetical protein